MKKKLKLSGLGIKCIYCGSDHITPRDKIFVRCLSCKRSFKIGGIGSEYIRNGSEVFVSIVASKSVFKFSVLACKLMNLKAGDKVIVGIDQGLIYVEKKKSGFEIRKDVGANRMVFSRATLVNRIRDKLDLDYYRSYKIKGEIINEKFKSVEIIDSSNAPRKPGGLTSTESFLLINKFHNTIRFSRKLADIMQIESGDRFIIGKDKGRIYIALSDSDQGFKISTGKWQSVTSGSVRAGRMILDHFKLDESKSNKIYVDSNHLKKNNMTFFELKMTKD